MEMENMLDGKRRRRGGIISKNKKGIHPLLLFNDNILNYMASVIGKTIKSIFNQ